MIPLKKPAMKRRTLLRGALAGGGMFAVGLPLLDAMLDNHGEALAQGSPLPTRFVSWFFGNGVNLDKFEPNLPGSSNYALSPLLQDLADIKEYLTVCTGVKNGFTGSAITHHEGLTAFNGYNFIPSGGLASEFGGPTVDQVIADRIAATSDAPPLHSLQLQISKTFSPADTGSTAQHLSAAGEPGALTFKRGASNPRQVWAALFGAPPAPEPVRSSMLDFLKADISQMRNRLGAADQVRMDNHLEAIRGLELLVGDRVACTAPAAPTEQNLQPNGEELITEVNGIMAGLLALAFQCDITRVASVIFVPLAGEVTLGVDLPQTKSNTHHLWGHNPTALGSTGAVDGLTGYEQTVRYTMNRFGDWLREFQDHLEPDGATTLLDTTIFYASSDCAFGKNHQINRQPVLLGGHGRGHLKHPGIHYQAIAGDPNLPSADSELPNGTLNNKAQPSARSTSDILLTCLRAFDAAATSVGDLGSGAGSTTPLLDIEA